MGALLRMLLLCTVAGVFSQELQFDYSYPEFVTQELDVSFTINASWNNNTETDTPDGRWINPKITLMDFNTNTYPGYTLSGDKLSLTVLSVTRDDIGYWHCIMTRRDENGTVLREDVLQRVGINVKGPYFVDLWQKYQRNVTIGLGSGFGFAVFAAVVCMAWQFRWEKRQQRRRVADASLEMDDRKSPVEVGKLAEKRGEEVFPPMLAATAITPVEQVTPGHDNSAYEAPQETEVKTTAFGGEENKQKEAPKKPSPPPSYTETEDIKLDQKETPNQQPTTESSTATTSTTSTTVAPATTSNTTDNTDAKPEVTKDPAKAEAPITTTVVPTSTSNTADIIGAKGDVKV